MMENAERALLPEGLHDDLPPDAAAEARIIEHLIGCFAAYGYDRVKPPLVEFEESLLSGPGAELARDMFRLMDPISQRMMAVRADMTTQVARIATTRLREAPRPLRLCYAGQVLRVRGSQLRPERQFAQAGIELIGEAGPGGVVEAILLAIEALHQAGLQRLSVDITLPTFIPDIAEAIGLNASDTAIVRQALEHKDIAQLSALPDGARHLFMLLLQAAGPGDDALAAMRQADLPTAVRPLMDGLEAVLSAIHAAMPELLITVDPGESSGFAYQSGLSFTLFSKGVRGELGRGGQYRLVSGEDATGATLYLDSVMRGVQAEPQVRQIYLPLGVDYATALALRADGWRTVSALSTDTDSKAQAKRLGCCHILLNGQPQKL